MLANFVGTSIVGPRAQVKTRSFLAVLQRICRAMLHCPTRCTSPGQAASDPASFISKFMVIEQQIWKITIFNG